MRWNPFARLRPSLRFLAAFRGKGGPPGETAASQASDFASESKDDDSPVRSINGGAQLELTDGERIRAIRLSRRLYYRNGVYGQLVDLFVSWILGDGVVVKHPDEAANEALQRVLDDPHNAFHARLADRVTRWMVDGELPWTFLVPYREQPERNSAGDPIVDEKGANRGQLSGVVYFGRADPLSLGEIKVDALDVDVVRSIEVTPLDGSGVYGSSFSRPLPVAMPGSAPVDVKIGAGALYLWRLNALGIRGVPFLSRIIDKADVLDRVVQGIADKVELTNRFYLHVEYPSSGNETKDAAFEKRVHEWLRKAAYGESCVTPVGVKFNAIAPDLKLPDSRHAYETTLEWNLGSVGVPRHWFGAGGETIRATAIEQGSPIHRMIRKRQADLAANVHAVAAYVLYVLKLAGVVAESVDENAVTVTTSDTASRDAVRELEALTALSNGVRDLREHNAVTREECQRIMRRQAESLPFGDVLDEEPPPMAEEGGEHGAEGEHGDGEIPSAQGPEAMPAPGADSSAGEAAKVADTALNGAQVQAVVEIAQAVSSGELPADTAVQILLASFPTWTPERAQAIVSPAEKMAAEKPPPQDPPPTPPPGAPPPPQGGRTPPSPKEPTGEPAPEPKG